MRCDWKEVTRRDGVILCRCSVCQVTLEVPDTETHFIATQPDCGVRRMRMTDTIKILNPNPRPVLMKERTYGELRDAIIAYLEKHITGTEPEIREVVGCSKTKGVLAGMTANGELLIDTPVIERDTVFSLPPIEIVDVVYPLGTGSHWNNNELRYSLRSLQKNFPNLGKVFVVGHKPNWLTNVIHIPYPDSHKHNKDANIIEKILAACDKGLSDNFVFMSDDQVILKPVTFQQMAPLHAGELKNKPDSYWDTTWKKHLRNSVNYLAASGKTTLHYDTHCPTPYSREQFKAAMRSKAWVTTPMCINTLAVNQLGLQGRPRGTEKVTIERRITKSKTIQKIFQGPYNYLGYNDTGLTKELKQNLATMFPEPSTFEAPPASRGIVILAGGPVYATNAYVNCMMLRKLGCTLPIEWYYLGAEMSPLWLDVIQRTIPNIRLIDLGGTNFDNAKHKGGWQAKVETIIQSQFDEVLYLDADSFPLKDPTYLFDHPLFQEHDCVLWPDIHLYTHCLQTFIQETYGVRVEGWQIESGQMLFRKEACMPGLLKTRALNQNSAHTYKHLFGDKDTFLIGAKQGGVKVTVVPHRVRKCSGRNLLQRDMDGNKMFVHLTRGKWGPYNPAEVGLHDYPHLNLAKSIYQKLRQSDVFLGSQIKLEVNMRVRDTTGAVEAANIVQNDYYIIRPMVGSGLVKYIVDIGGNAGAFTYMASLCYPEAEIICVEPDPELMADIKYNTKDCKAKIHYVEAACVGTPCEKVTFVRVAANRGGGFVREGEWEKQREEVQLIEPEDEVFSVPAVTLPSLLEKYRFQSIDILKIDAEGVEGVILQSLKEAGWMPRVHWIRGEWHGRQDQPRIKAALQDTHEVRLCDGLALGYMIAHNLKDA